MWRIADNIKFSDFFGLSNEVSSARLEIPEFQRNYVWWKDKIKELLDAISENDEWYYIWNIVTILDNWWSTSKDKVVDWQQRLVTISLLLSAIYHTIPTLKLEIENKIFEVAPDNPRIYFSRESLNNIYIWILKANPIPSTLDSSQKKILEAYLYIKDTWLNNITDIDDFLNKVKNIEFVVIKCETEDDAFQLFEWLNSTGVSLWPIELIKNAVFSKIKELDNSKLEEFINKWEEIEKKFEKNNFIWFQKFIRQQFFWDFWPVWISKLFKAIKNEKIKNKNISEVTEYIQNIYNDSDIYLELRKGDFNFISLEWRMPLPDRWESMNIIKNISYFWLDQIYSILLALIKYWKLKDVYFRANFIIHLRKLLAFLLIAKFSKISPASYEGLIARTCKNINGRSYTEFKTNMDSFFSELVTKITWTRESFILDFSKNFSWNDFSESFCRSILIWIYSLNEKTGSILNSLEHIIPKAFSNWTILSPENKKTVDKKVWNIWNLTILEENLNNDIENFLFDEKVTRWFNLSSLWNINTEVISYSFSSNPLTAVDERWEYLAWKIYDYYFNILSS